MRKGFVTPKDGGSSSNSINREAFAFLPRCVESTYDMTSAEPLRLSKHGVDISSKLRAVIADYDDRDYVEVHGESRGDPTVLAGCIDFFSRFGIPANTSNTSLCNNILSAIDDVLLKIELSGSRKIIVCAPTFGYYFKQLETRGISFEILQTKFEDGFLPNPLELEALIAESGAKTLLLCYPNNPSGVVMTQDCAEAIADVVKRHDVFVISDEAFINNSLSEKRHFPIAAVEGMVDRSFTVTSMAKSVCMGRKTGFCVGREDIISMFERLGGYPTKHDQRVIAAAMENNEDNSDYLARCRDYYLQNIGIIKTKLNSLSEKFCHIFGEEKVYVKPLIDDPEATNVYILDFSGLKGKIRNGKEVKTGLDVSEWLLEDASIGSVPGECFIFPAEAMLIRIVLNQTPLELEQAFDAAILAADNIQNPPRGISRSSSAKSLTSLQLGLDGAGI